MQNLIRLCLEKAAPQCIRGVQTKRKALGFGCHYYWNGLTICEWSELTPLLELLRDKVENIDVYNQCLVNIYTSGGRIGEHLDRPYGMAQETPICSVSYGWKDDTIVKEDIKLGYLKIEGEKIEILNGIPIVFDGYNIKHSAYTSNSKEFEKRINFTLRRRM